MSIRYIDDSKFEFICVFTLNGGVVSWKGSKQETIVDSTIEVGHFFAYKATKKIVWIKTLITKLGAVPVIVNLMAMYCDNNGATT